MAEEKTKKLINIYPSKPTKRILIALGDIMIAFIASVFIFEIAAKPIMQATPFFKENSALHNEAEHNRTQILYDNNLLFFDDVEIEKYNFSANLERTANKFIRYYCFGQENDQFETIYHYYVEMLENDVNVVNEYFVKYGEKYFDTTSYTPLGTYNLKSEYINFFKPNFEKGNEMSEDGKKHYSNFTSNVFLVLYSNIMTDIKNVHDLKSPLQSNLLSYNEYTKQIIDLENTIQNSYVLISYISFGLITIGAFFVFPLLNHKGQTLSEKVAKVEHVDKKTLEYLPKRYRVILGAFNLVHSLSVVFAIPILTYGFTNLFSLPLLYSVSFVSILVLIMELIFLLVTNLNQTIKEIGTNSIVVDTVLMDTYYKEKNYGI